MNTPLARESVHVAVAVIVNDKKEILIALRSENQHQGGLWEFPGGKVEEGESVSVALARELAEELGISVSLSKPLVKIHHDYTDKSVLLDVWWVEEFEGKAEGLEGQPLRWVTASALSDYQFPEANLDIVRSVQKQLLNGSLQ